MEYPLEPLNVNRKYWVYQTELGKERKALVGCWNGCLNKGTSSIDLVPYNDTHAKECQTEPLVQSIINHLQRRTFYSTRILRKATKTALPMNVFRANEYGLEISVENYIACIRFVADSDYPVYVFIYDKKILKDLNLI